MERVSRALELAGAAMSRTGIEEAVSGKAAAKRQAIDHLLADGYVAADGPRRNGGRPTIRLVQPYREGMSLIPPDWDRVEPARPPVPDPDPVPV